MMIASATAWSQTRGESALVPEVAGQREVRDVLVGSVQLLEDLKCPVVATVVDEDDRPAHREVVHDGLQLAVEQRQRFLFVVRRNHDGHVWRSRTRSQRKRQVAELL